MKKEKVKALRSFNELFFELNKRVNTLKKVCTVFNL